MVGDQLFLNTPLSVGVSLDAKTGEPRWIYNPKAYEDGTSTSRPIHVINATVEGNFLHPPISYNSRTIDNSVV